jgi:hypothetical protein
MPACSDVSTTYGFVKITHGCRVIPTIAVDTTSSWYRGNVLEVPSATGTLRIHNGVNDFVTGIANEDYATGFDEISARNNEGSLILGEGVIETDVVAAGITFAIGDRLYSDANGFLTNVPILTYSQAGRSRQYGQVYALAVSAAGTIKFHFRIEDTL